ncbi:MFS transporter [Kluyvera ascorbata]|uniref:MFS transporter n=1 Tax=Kluyvera ascorbata TaxID=51288 RepID=UPI0018A56F5A|nr:MFS transporter [Kluyvera ascorbata]BBV66444.1 MFS transporter [Klebsiella sp. STW0522-44]MDU3914593.1 MFS transporter [Kluyvera ascorbata]HCL5622781.1 MFS transporter [Kluyvera ascorbata]HDG1665654.1 MFS transporter [Kluyvera ascorbata]HDG1706402.1 MFS transporter [Kluyvera ascorbata]
MNITQNTGGFGAPEITSVWSAVISMALLCFVLVSSEFMPVSLLTPIAKDLSVTEGQAGQAIAFSGLFAVITSLFGNTLLARFDRRTAIIFYTLVMVLSGLIVTSAHGYGMFMFGRALIGISIGGFWSLSTAILVRIVRPVSVPKAIAILQGGTALAFVVAPPLGSFLGSLIGWRGAFFTVVPAGVICLIWQMVVIPKLPQQRDTGIVQIASLLRSRTFALGMIAVTLAFMGQFSLSTYLRPFLEGVTGLGINMISLFLLGVGVAGLTGTLISGFFVRGNLLPALTGLPAGQAIVAGLLTALGHIPAATGALLLVWGILVTPIPVVWNTWMTRIIPDELEAGGALTVALIQFAITIGAFTGGELFDHQGWVSTFMLATALLIASAVIAVLPGRRSFSQK